MKRAVEGGRSIQSTRSLLGTDKRYFSTGTLTRPTSQPQMRSKWRLFDENRDINKLWFTEPVHLGLNKWLDKMLHVISFH